MSFFSKQFIDILQWPDPAPDVLSARYPMEDQEIQTGAQLVVRETQAALFLNEGQLADLFTAGTHKLTTQTLPILTYLNNWDKAFQSPFKSDVFFFNLREQLDQKWARASLSPCATKNSGLCAFAPLAIMPLKSLILNYFGRVFVAVALSFDCLILMANCAQPS